MKAADLSDHRIATRAAWAPLLFQAAKTARDLGLLTALVDGPKTPAEVSAKTKCSLYAARVLLEGCEVLELVKLEPNDRFSLTAAGELVRTDEMTRVNMNFTHDVCYQGAFYLRESLEQGKPAGLHHTFGAQWPTIYPALTHLPEPAKTSWFAFDHFYSDPVFRLAIAAIANSGAKTVLDVGGNTGRFAVQAAKSLKVTVLDFAEQLSVARENARQAGVELSTHPIDLLDHSQPFPRPFDAVWMSQLVDCFPEADIVGLMKRARSALAPNGRLFVNEPLVDRQPQDVARFNVQATSLYFSCMANGTSRMYHSRELIDCARAAELRFIEERRVGAWHTLLVFGL
jgi:2-polyprenyl-3-methyl-5-hydroxy-6-metoxy-1,4-benzoquinol methylase